MAEEILNNTMTAQILSELLQDKTAEQWAVWLQNNRNQSRRVPYRIPFQRINGGIFYAREELEKFVEFEKQRTLGAIKLTGRAAEVLRAYGGSTNGRKLKIITIDPQADETTAQMYIQVVADDPLMVFRLELDEAQAVATKLTAAINYIARFKS